MIQNFNEKYLEVSVDGEVVHPTDTKGLDSRWDLLFVFRITVIEVLG